MSSHSLQFAGAAVALFFVGFVAMAGAKKENAPANSAAKGIAVVELFSSEGCSSCPPADDALAEIVQTAADRGQPVFALAFHVDYWNSLGWTDPYSSAAFTARQRDYAGKMHLSSLYTPQMVVNGSTELVGSNRASAREAINTALATAPAGTLAATVEAKPAGGFTVNIKPVGLDEKSTVLNVALVEGGLSSNVKRGENSGRLLKHENVVRWFASRPLSEPASLHVEVPKLDGVKLDHASFIIYAQNANDWHILAATQGKTISDKSAVTK